MKSVFAVAVVVIAWCAYCNGLDLKPYENTAYITFVNSDLNNDGNLTLDEMMTDFIKYDTNHDGNETREEYTMYICSKTPTLYELSHKLFDEYDYDNNTVLDVCDYYKFFQRMDKDGDGFVVIPEFLNLWTSLFEDYEYYHSDGKFQGDCSHIQVDPAQ